MGQFIFGVGRGRVNADTKAKIDEVCERHGVAFTAAEMPGEGHKYWFAGPNLGHPFDQALKQEVWADLIAAGLIGADGHLNCSNGGARFSVSVWIDDAEVIVHGDTPEEISAELAAHEYNGQSVRITLDNGETKGWASATKWSWA